MKPSSSFACFFTLLLVLAFQTSCNNNNNEPAVLPQRDTLKSVSTAQSQNIDQSPLDISYCPAEYPQNKMKGVETGIPTARIIYSRPHKKGRIIFSDDPKSLCQYGKPWRLGANEATEIEFFKPVMINGKNITPGRYIMYCIPHKDKWEIAFNTNLHSWGLDIDESKDIFRTETPVLEQTPTLEDYTMFFQNSPDGAELVMAWDNVKVLLPITYSK